MKSCIVTRGQTKFIYFSLVFILSILMVITSVRSAVTTVQTHTKRKLPIYAVKTDEKKIALTLDCAWENSDTQILVDTFKKYNIKVTFFVTGDFCERYPDDIKLWASEGHSIQNHSNRHPHVKNIEKQKLIDDTTKCDEIIEKTIGKKPKLYRAPYGEFSDSMLEVFETDLNHKVIQWDIDSVDWKKPTSSEIVNRVMKNIKNGSILLFHNDTKPTPEALNIIIPKLQSQGYEFVLVEDLILYDNYKLDHEGRQISLKN